MATALSSSAIETVSLQTKGASSWASEVLAKLLGRSSLARSRSEQRTGAATGLARPCSLSSETELQEGIRCTASRAREAD